MKNDKLKKAAKDLQKNYRHKIDQYFGGIVKELDRNERFRNNKAARLSLLSGMGKCLTVGDKKPAINSEDIFELLAPFCLDEYLEDIVVKLMRCRIPTLDFIFRDLAFLRKEFAGIKFNNGKLTVTTHDVTLNNINFGQFDMFFNLSLRIPNHHEDVGVSVKALEPNYPSGDRSHSHPHVEGQALCAGYGQRALYGTLKDLRIFDYFQIVNIILNTYGDGPFVEIGAWSSERCNDCGGYEFPDDMGFCVKCNEKYCYGCIDSTCTDCFEAYCGFCLTASCTKCLDKICPDCKVDCNVCKGACCTDCVSDSCCGVVHMDSCSEECNSCDNIVCNDCTKTCPDCKKTQCKDCLVECASCDSKMCKSCATKCEDCDSTYHRKCEYICCEI